MWGKAWDLQLIGINDTHRFRRLYISTWLGVIPAGARVERLRGLGNELKFDINSCDLWDDSPWVPPRQPKEAYKAGKKCGLVRTG